MALRNTHSDANLVIERGLNIHYGHTTITGSWSYAAGVSIVTLYTMFECHRYATKSFRYVGMTYAAAKACQEAMKTIFTRDVYVSFFNTGTWSRQKSGSVLLADISLEPAGGDAWDVSVSVNEDDVCFKRTNETFNPVNAFAYERNRSYGSDGHGNASEMETTQQ